MSEQRLNKWQQRYGALLEPGEQVRSAVFGSTVGWWVFEGVGGLLLSLLLLPYLSDKGRTVLLTDRHVYVLQTGFLSPKAKAVRAKFPTGGYPARRRGGELVIGEESIYVQGWLRERVKLDLAAILAGAESAENAPRTRS